MPDTLPEQIERVRVFARFVLHSAETEGQVSEPELLHARDCAATAAAASMAQRAVALAQRIYEAEHDSVFGRTSASNSAELDFWQDELEALQQAIGEPKPTPVT